MPDTSQCSHHYLVLSHKGTGDRRLYEKPCDRRRCPDHGQEVCLNEVDDMMARVFTPDAFQHIYHAVVPEACAESFKDWHRKAKDSIPPHYVRFQFEKDFGVFVPEPLTRPLFRRHQVEFQEIAREACPLVLMDLLSRPTLIRVTRRPPRASRPAYIAP